LVPPLNPKLFSCSLYAQSAAIITKVTKFSDFLNLFIGALRKQQNEFLIFYEDEQEFDFGRRNDVFRQGKF